ncbi:hypothetical protein I6N95_18155 [Vagococcus sp. BWB3-3]|uniref:Uncharacterized protein n=1 Tax=Vagococcus allomyrinae TaxID=2794353 RepID=A0A940SX67_9ENTE|nr:hypothetical protein [Vagococcus allomyrinae]MBP1042941.1 hypothetical protein [Vagococcus allomyrinae]
MSIIPKKEKVVGTIVELYTMGPETQTYANGKKAIFSYRIDDKVYNSTNRIYVPLASRLGDQLAIYYEVGNPSKVFRKLLQSASDTK